MARVEFDSYEPVPIPGGSSNIADELFNKGLDCSVRAEGEARLIEAHKWFNLAALKGNKQAIQYRQEISEELGREKVLEAQRAARKWLKSH